MTINSVLQDITIFWTWNKRPMSAYSKLPSWDILIRNPRLMCALGFGAGLVPRAPGTFGTLVAIPIIILLANVSYWLLALTSLVFLAAGIQICKEASSYFKSHDHSSIVWDEIVGYMFTMSFAPISMQTITVGFILFRFFDILKPWPISWLDKNIHGAWGIMADDLVAGLFAAACLQVCLWQGWLIA